MQITRHAIQLLRPWPRLGGRLNLAQQFMMASLVILVVGMVGVGAWVDRQIALGVIHRSAATTALYVASFIEPNLQELAASQMLHADHIASLDRLLSSTAMGQQIVAFKIWDANGLVIYSTDTTEIGHTFPVEAGLAQSWHGEVAAQISDLSREENVQERQLRSKLLEIYVPVRQRGADQIIAVVEFYQTIDDLNHEIASARWQTVLVFGGVTVVMYLLLAGFVGRASDTIARQQAALRIQVAQLTELIGHNTALHERVQGAAAGAAATNERLLRRISAELHDGPLQDLGLALLRLDHLAAPADDNIPDVQGYERDMTVVQQSLQRAMQEVRAISAGLGLPHLEQLAPTEIVARVVRTHERRSGTLVALELVNLPEEAPLPVKITLYRVIQEALTNAYRHAGGQGQQVSVRGESRAIVITVADTGPGITAPVNTDQLGLSGMRERVESLGGTFHVECVPSGGTCIRASIPL